MCVLNGELTIINESDTEISFSGSYFSCQGTLEQEAVFSKLRTAISRCTLHLLSRYIIAFEQPGLVRGFPAHAEG